jgi:Tropinone reductase 1
LRGKRALVTGGTKGIGEACVNELLGLGASVVLVARNADEVQARTEALQQAGHSAHGLAADFATEQGRASVFAFVEERLGGLDILVNNVGTNIRKGSLAYTADEYEKVVNTNMTATWEACRRAYPLLSEAAKQNGDSAIVNIGSVSGDRFVGSGAPYAMTKAAVDNLTRYLAVEWAALPVRVNSVNPWYTRTPLASAVLQNEEFTKRVLEFTPNGKLAEPEDISAAVAFLCLPAARHITGQTLTIDGGYSARGFDWPRLI